MTLSPKPAPTSSDSNPDDSRLPKQFAWVCCQHGAENPVKNEVQPQGWRLAFSRPGFVTFKSELSPQGTPVATNLPRGIFTRTSAWSLGKFSALESNSVIEQLQALLSSQTDDPTPPRFDLLHLWQRDRLPIGTRGFMPSDEALTSAIGESLGPSLNQADIVASSVTNQIARYGDRILDLVLVDPGQWWAGWHRAQTAPDRWPGGTLPANQDRQVISRAYYKTSEAIAWSGFPFKEGDHVVEIGSAPGGSVQRLLELGMRVTGVDPAEMDETILNHAHYRHIRARGGDIRRNQYAKARWLLVDSNVRPEKTLVTVKNIVTHERTHIQGMLLTLKLGTHQRTEDIPHWLDVIRSWGYSRISARQLATGRTEICVAALRDGDAR